MKHNWKFVKVGMGQGGIKYMLCEGDKLIKEYTNKNCPGGMLLEYAMLKEKELIESGSFEGHTISDYIKQCNYNASANESDQKTDVVLLDIHGWKRLQKELENGNKK